MSEPLAIVGASRRRKLAVIFGTMVAALAVAGLALSSGGPNSQLVQQDRLYGGGGTDPGCFVPDIGFCRPGPTDFSVDAHATGTGSTAYGNTGNRSATRAEVTCLAVDGHNAAVGTRIVSSPDPSRVGWVTLTYYVDNGPGHLDQVSPTYSGPAEPSSWPASFPNQCPSPDVDTPEFGLIRSFLPISRGDVVVQDGANAGGNN